MVDYRTTSRYNECGDWMARPAMNEDDPLTARQFSIPASMFKALKRASAVSGKSAAQIVRDALAVELEKPEYNGD